MATFPGRGLYTRHLGHPEGVDGVDRPTVRPANRREPAVLDRHWLNRHLAEVDIVHLHGLPAWLDPQEVAATADTIRAAGTPLVVTGYHLSDPTGRSGPRYGYQLDQLIPRADAVVTLTEPAAAEMRRRWGVDPVVLPHPHAVDFVRMRQARPPRRGEFLIGMHLAGLNLPVDPVLLTDALTRAVSRLQSHHPEVRLVVHAHASAADPGATGYAPRAVRLLNELVRGCGGRLRMHRPFTESQLWDHLLSLDLSVMPGLFGSHSIWPEACADLGTQALLPARTPAAAQQPCLPYTLHDGRGERDDTGSGNAGRDNAGRDGGRHDGRLDVAATAESLFAALATAVDGAPPRRTGPEQRWTERVMIAESLRGIYERLLAR